MYNFTDGRPIIPTNLSHNEIPINNLRGLIDTGASYTVISRKYLEELEVDFDNPDGTFPGKVSNGQSVNLEGFYININIGDGLIIKNRFMVACSEQDYDHVDLLIGTDILMEVVLFFNGINQTYTIST